MFFHTINIDQTDQPHYDHYDDIWTEEVQNWQEMMGNEACIPAPGRRPTRRRATAARSKESSSEFPNPSHRRRRRPLPHSSPVLRPGRPPPASLGQRRVPPAIMAGFPPAGEGRAGGSGNRRPANPPERGERDGGDYGRKESWISEPFVLDPTA